MRKKITLFGCLIFVAIIAYGQNNNQDAVFKLLTTAEVSLENKNYKASLEQSKKATAILKNSSDTLISLYGKSLYLQGKALIGLKGFSKSAAVLNQAIQLNPLQSTEVNQLMDTYIHLSIAQKSSRNYTAAKQTILDGLELIKNKNGIDNRLLGEANLVLAQALRKMGKYREALQYVEKSKNILQPLESLKDAKMGYILNLMGILYNRLGEYHLSVQAYEQALVHFINDKGKNHITVGDSYYNLANVFINLAANSKALQYYEKAEAIYLANGRFAYTSDCYVGMGIVFRRWGDYERALDFYQKGLEAKLKKEDPYPPNLATTYRNMGILYSHLHKGEASKTYLEKALSIQKEFFGDKHTYYARTLQSIGIIQAEQGQLEAALSSLKKSRQIYESTNPKHQFIAQIDVAMGDVYVKLKEASHAVAAFDRGIKLMRKQEPHYPDLASWLSKKAEILAFQNKYQQALNTLDTAMQVLEFDESKWQMIEETERFLPLLRVLNVQGDLHQLLYEQQEDILSLEKAGERYQLAIQVLEHLRGSYKAEGSKQYAMENHAEIFSRQMEVQSKLFKLRNDQSYLELAFETAERNKGLLLAEAMQKAELQKNSNLPKHILEIENNLKADIILYEKLKHEETKKTISSDSILIVLNDKIFTLKNQLYTFNDSLKRQFPEFGNLAKAFKIPDTKTVDTNLTDTNTALIEYFIADNRLFIFTFYQKQCFLDEISLPANFKEILLAYCQDLSDPRSIISNETRNFLYNKLLEAPFIHLPLNTIQKLVIIPDAWLGYLPFETLPTVQGEGTYLVYAYEISYAYAAHLLLEQKAFKNKKKAKILAGFAPEYQENNALIAEVLRSADGNSLSDLPGAKKEVEKIANIFKGDVYSGQNISELKFRQIASNYRILHLSMHAQLDDDNPLYSRFIFTTSQDTIHDGELTAAELSNLPLQAELAVLSACNTGFGTIKKGEGIMSLSRAFMYAGVPATVMSLWKVPDGATSDIMTAFYQSLKNGGKKDAALRQAKLAYLNNALSPELKHPFYWAGFVAAGDMKPIISNQTKYFFLLLIGASISLSYLVYRIWESKQRGLTV